MAALAGLCLVCARHLWVAPRVRSWLFLAAMNSMMLVFHGVVLTGPYSSAHLSHSHAGADAQAALAAAALHPHSGPAMALLTSTAIIQIVCAAIMLAWHRRVWAAHYFGAVIPGGAA